MNDYINSFTEHLSEALEIGRSTKLNACQKEIRNVLIEGYRSARPLNSKIEKELNTLTMVRTLILLGWANDRRELMGKEFFTSYIDHLMPAVDSYLKES